jgi:hypothetical protein
LYRCNGKTVLTNSTDVDPLSNPSARIVVGRLGTVGTGSFDVLAPVLVQDPLKEEVLPTVDEDVEMEDA